MTSALTQLEIKAEWISHSEKSSVVKLCEGLTSRGFDLQTGLVSPVGVFRTLVIGRIMSLLKEPNHKNFLDHRKLTQDHLLFVVTGEMSISRDVYNVQLPKYPVTLNTRLVSFRKSSFILETSLALPGSQDAVASLSTNIVCVGKDTRKSTSLPDWWGNKYVELFDKTNGQYLKPLVYPKELICQGLPSHLYTFAVRRREQDQNGHVNTALYLQYCIDALEHHLYSNNIHCDINTVSLLLKSSQFLHKGESKMGDMLDVAFWDDETNPETVCFDIIKSGQSIYQARMQFYGGSEVFGAKSRL